MEEGKGGRSVEEGKGGRSVEEGKECGGWEVGVD